MIKKINLILILLFSLLLFHSCSKENPVGYGINQIWGTTEYMPYDWYFNWQYQVDIPADSSQFELWYYVFGKEYIKPYSGWEVAIIYDGVPSGYYYLDANPGNGIYRFNPDVGEWVLIYELPIIDGNGWHSETFYLDAQEREWREKLDAIVRCKEEVEVIAGSYENCLKIYLRVIDFLVDTTGNDSSYYYEMHEWYAPNVGLIKWEVTNSDISEFVGQRGLLKRKFTEPFAGSYHSYQLKKMKSVSQGGMRHIGH